MSEIKQMFYYQSITEHCFECLGQYYNSRKINMKHTNLKRNHKIVVIYIENPKQSSTAFNLIESLVSLLAKKSTY